MGIRQQNQNLTISKKKAELIERCSATEETIVFSFRHMTSCDDYNFHCFEKKKKNSELSRAINSLMDKLSELSQMTWSAFFSKGRTCGGADPIPAVQMEDSFLNGISGGVSDDEKLISVRFNSGKSRFIIKRGTKCRRVAHVLGIDYDLKLYKH